MQRKTTKATTKSKVITTKASRVKRLNKRNVRSKNNIVKPKRVFKVERTPDRQSQRLKNKKLGIILPKIDPDKPYVIDNTVKVNNNKAQLTKTQSKPKLQKKNTSILSNGSDVLEKQKKYYNQIAVDEAFKKQASMSGYNKDRYGNLAGNKFDLAMDMGFRGHLIAVLQLYSSLTFDDTEKALKEKGFEIHLWNKLPDINEFKNVLQKSCQLWIISDFFEHIKNDEYLELIKIFFEQGRGLYIWGDNQPFYADANKVAKHLFHGSMSGDVSGGKVIHEQKEEKKCGLMKNHLITTGIDYLFEGITIATIADNPDLQPLLYGSADNLVVAVYEKYGRRAILDGGFTRLYCNWDTAGTGRYVKNAAAFLANIENFG